MDTDDTTNAKSRFHSFLNNAERIYLVILRAAILIIATICLIWALWLATSGVFGISRNAASVREVEASVTANEVAATPLAEGDDAKTDAKDPQAAQRAYYEGFAKRYYALYRSGFEAYRQKSDAQIPLKTFDDKFLGTPARLQAIHDGDLNFETDKADLETLFGTMKETAALPVTKDRLTRYQRTARQRVEKKVKGTRSESYCSYYGYYIDACITYATRQVPYTQTTVSMELPKGIVSYETLFGKYQETFFSLLHSRRDSNARLADQQRTDIIAGNQSGRISLWTAVQVLGSFLVLMFFFLLIAIERHQRLLARRFGT